MRGGERGDIHLVNCIANQWKGCRWEDKGLTAATVMDARWWLPKDDPTDLGGCEASLHPHES